MLDLNLGGVTVWKKEEGKEKEMLERIGNRLRKNREEVLSIIKEINLSCNQISYVDVKTFINLKNLTMINLPRH